MNFQNEYSQVMEIAPSRRAFYSSFTAISYFFLGVNAGFLLTFKGKIVQNNEILNEKI
jgi:hypothetical protein